jgi:hypothetical protein
MSDMANPIQSCDPDHLRMLARVLEEALPASAGSPSPSPVRRASHVHLTAAEAKRFVAFVDEHT